MSYMLNPLADEARRDAEQEASASRADTCSKVMAQHVVEQIRHSVDEKLPNVYDRRKEGYAISAHLADSSTAGDAQALLFKACHLALNNDRAEEVAKALAEFVQAVADEYGSNYAQEDE